MQGFQIKKITRHLGVAVLKLMSNESESAKKIYFSELLFLLVLEAGVSAFAAVRIGSISSKNF